MIALNVHTYELIPLCSSQSQSVEYGTVWMAFIYKNFYFNTGSVRHSVREPNAC